MSNIELPYNRDAEEALLGAIFINPNLLDDPDISKVKPEDFYVMMHVDIWRAIQTLGRDVDIVTVSTLLDSASTKAYIMGLINFTPTFTHARTYAKEVIDLAVRRRYIRLAGELTKEAYRGDVDPVRYVQALVDTQRVDGGAVPIASHLSEFVDLVEKRAKDPKDIWGIPTGFLELDRRIGGLQREQTLLLAAPPGRGKSVLAMQIAHNVAKQKHAVVIYSYEMSAQRVLTRLISADSGVRTRAMHTGHMDGHWDKFYQSVERFEDLDIYISDIYGMTTSELRSDLSRIMSGKEVSLVVVDYLNKLLDSDGGDDVSNTRLKSQRMQSICREFNVSGIFIQSMNKEGMRATVPMMADMSGPAETAHEGDNVFLIGKHPDYRDIIQLYPAKMRDGDGASDPISLRWDEGVPKFLNVTSVPLEDL